MYQKSSAMALPAYDEGLRRFMLGVFNNMGIGLVISAIVSFMVSSSPDLMQLLFDGPQRWLVILAPLAMSLAIGFGIQSLSPATGRLLFYLFSAVMGLSLSTIFIVYSASSIANAFFGTAIMFGVMSIWGYTTKRDLTRMGSFLIMGAIGIVAASLLNLFFQSGPLSMAISTIAVLVFTGLTAYDVQSLKNLYDQLDGDERDRAGIMGALSLYINFINIFISLLQLFGATKE
jgi:FtsH-binding integral membrane protein